MAFTYTTLKAAIQDYLESDEQTLVNQLPTIIRQAEERILLDAQLPDFRKNVTGSMTASDQYLGIPADFLSPYSLAVTVPAFGSKYLRFKEVNLLREMFPSSGNLGTPKYYAIFEDEFFIVAPTPDQNYAVELHYFYKPESITESGDGTSWLGTHAESALLYGCLLEGYTFQKGDADMMSVYGQRYQDAIMKLKVLAEGRNKIDTYRIS